MENLIFCAVKCIKKGKHVDDFKKSNSREKKVTISVLVFSQMFQKYTKDV